jgi:hypothetical protein
MADLSVFREKWRQELCLFKYFPTSEMAVSGQAASNLYLHFYLKIEAAYFLAAAVPQR